MKMHPKRVHVQVHACVHLVYHGLLPWLVLEPPQLVEQGLVLLLQAQDGVVLVPTHVRKLMASGGQAILRGGGGDSVDGGLEEEEGVQAPRGEVVCG